MDDSQDARKRKMGCGIDYRDARYTSQPSTAAPGLHIPISINIDQGDDIDGAPVETTQRQEEKRARRVYLKQSDF